MNRADQLTVEQEQQEPKPMGALSGSTYHNFQISTKTFARHLVQQLEAGRYDERQATERLAEALMRAAKRGAQHPEWFADDLHATALEHR